MFRLLRSRVTHLNVVMSTNKRINCDKAGGASKKSRVHDPNVALDSLVNSINDLKTMNIAVCEVMPSPIKSASDKKNYRAIQLNNGLRALLISDPIAIVTPINDPIGGTFERDHCPKDAGRNDSEDIEALSSADEDENEDAASGSYDEAGEDRDPQKQAACALCVDVGSFSDPREVQGLAHFLGKSS